MKVKKDSEKALGMGPSILEAPTVHRAPYEHFVCAVLLHLPGNPMKLMKVSRSGLGVNQSHFLAGGLRTINISALIPTSEKQGYCPSHGGVLEVQRLYNEEHSALAGQGQCLKFGWYCQWGRSQRSLGNKGRGDPLSLGSEA